MAAMTWRRGLVAVSPLILLTGTAQCGAASDAPPAQVLLWVDTDAPAAASALAQPGDAGSSDGQQHDPHLFDAAVDTLRIDVLKPDNTIADLREISAPDEANWPISFGVPSLAGINVVRLRLRAFRAERAQLGPSPLDPAAQVFEPVPGYTIDRVVEIPLPADRGDYAYRIVLRSECRGNLPDFVQGNSCVDGANPEGRYRAGIQFVDAHATPSREPMWWPADNGPGCDPGCVDGVCCIPGGFFMLGNIRVVGFRTLRRHDAVPPHPVAMKPFRIDALEMSVARWTEAKLAPPSYDPTRDPNCTWKLGPNSTVVQSGPLPASTPMNCVTWDDAEQACEKLGGRLPTEAEWEYVSTGRGRGNLFPWGDTPPRCSTAVLARYDSFGIAECAPDTADPGAVGTPASHELDQSDGVMDLAGSLSEWMLDTFLDYDQDPPGSNPPCWRRDGLLTHPACLSVGTTKSVRGGSFASPMEVSYVALRNAEEQTNASGAIGFRCVYPVGPDPVAGAGSGSSADPGAPSQDGGKP